MMTEYKYNIISKVVVIGDGAVGKTSLISQYTQGTFNKEYITTIGAQFSKYETVLGDNNEIFYRLLFWDIAGQDEFIFMRPTFYKGAEGAILVYDVTRPETLDNVAEWFEEMRNNCGDIPSVLFGNKIDLLEDPASYDDSEAQKILKKFNILDFYTTSAKTGQHVTDAFNSIINILVKKKIGK